MELSAVVDRLAASGLSARLASHFDGRQCRAAIDPARESPQEHGRSLPGRAAGSGHRRAPGGTVRRAPGQADRRGLDSRLRAGRRFCAGCRRATGRTAAGLAGRHARARCLRGAGRQDLPHPGTGRRASDRHRRGRQAFAAHRGKSRAPGPGRHPEGAGCAIERVVGRPAVRPHPGRRAVHGLGNRAPPSRYPLVAPQGRRVPTCNTFIQNSGQPVADAAPRW
ncbi:hypothetical protein D3C72_1653770 [compost metagenome]